MENNNSLLGRLFNEMTRRIDDITKPLSPNQQAAPNDKSLQFSELRTAICQLIDGAMSYSTKSVFVAAQVKFAQIAEGKYDVELELYCRDTECNDASRAMKYPFSLSAVDITKIHPVVRQDMQDNNGKTTITFDQKDLQEFVVGRNKPIDSSDTSVIDLAHKVIPEGQNGTFTLVVSDFVLYYKMVVCRLEANGGNKGYVGEFLTDHLNGLSAEAIASIQPGWTAEVDLGSINTQVVN